MTLKKYLPLVLTSCLSAIMAVGLYVYFQEPQEVIIREAYPTNQANLDDYLFNRQPKYRSSAVTPTDFTSASKAATPAVVFITTKQVVDYDIFGGASYGNSSGSGVIISPSGYIVTNHHVIENGEKLFVTLNDNREYEAEVVGKDPTTDLALLKIDETNLPFVPFGDSDALEVGQWVLAIGNPFRLQSTVTAGIVSAKARNINILNQQQYDIEAFIQTDAAVNPGNSGGALVNTEGELIGINTAIITYSGQYEGYSFAVPSSLAQKVVRDLKEYGSVQRGLLGVNIESIDAKLAKKLQLPSVNGVHVSWVIPESAAALSGLKVGDVITKINDLDVSSSPELQEQVARYRPGDKLSVGYFRKGQYYVSDVVLKNYRNTTELIASNTGELLEDIGLDVRDLSTAEKRKLETRGVKVESILKNSKIDRSKMEPNFIITKVNKKRISSTKELLREINVADEMVILEGFYENYSGLYWYTFKK